MGSRVLVGGGTGFIGRRLVDFLKKDGYKVTVVSRSPGKDCITWDDISSGGLPNETASVINLSGENLLNFARRWTEEFKQEVYRSRVETTRTLAKAIDAASKKPSSFVAISGVGIYPPSAKEKYDEESKVEAYDFISKMCHDWEAAAAVQDKTCKVANIRCGVVLGRRGGMIKNLWIPFYCGLGGPIGFGHQYMPWIHLDDIACLIIYAMEHQLQGIYNGVSPHLVTNKRFSKIFAKSLNRKAFIPTPPFVFDLLLGKERAQMVTRGQFVVPKATMAAGFKYLYPELWDACDSFSES